MKICSSLRRLESSSTLSFLDVDIHSESMIKYFALNLMQELWKMSDALLTTKLTFSEGRTRLLPRLLGSVTLIYTSLGICGLEILSPALLGVTFG